MEEIEEYPNSPNLNLIKNDAYDLSENKTQNPYRQVSAYPCDGKLKMGLVGLQIYWPANILQLQ